MEAASPTLGSQESLLSDLTCKKMCEMKTVLEKGLVDLKVLVQIFEMKSHESHFWQQAFTPHCHSFSSGQSLSKLAAGWRIMAGIENSVMLWQIIKYRLDLAIQSL